MINQSNLESSATRSSDRPQFSTIFKYKNIIALGIIIGFLSGKIWVLITVDLLNLNGKQQINGYHYHHSLLSIVPLLLIPFTLNRKLLLTFLVSLIIGIILEHRLTYGGFYFITSIK